MSYREHGAEKDDLVLVAGGPPDLSVFAQADHHVEWVRFKPAFDPVPAVAHVGDLGVFDDRPTDLDDQVVFLDVGPEKFTFLIGLSVVRVLTDDETTSDLGDACAVGRVVQETVNDVGDSLLQFNVEIHLSPFSDTEFLSVRKKRELNAQYIRLLYGCQTRGYRKTSSSASRRSISVCFSISCSRDSSTSLAGALLT
jgi:hypothetical protein